MFAAGFTPRLFSGFDDRELLALGIGLTTIVAPADLPADLTRRFAALRAGVGATPTS